MEQREEGRSARKHAAILRAAAEVFLTKGYAGTSMDDIAKLAVVSKQTVYKHFTDKEALFAEIILATTDQVDEVVRLVADVPAGTPAELSKVLDRLARSFLDTLMRPEVLDLRRLVIANADRFPDISRTWYERGFERVLITLSGSFQRLADQGLLRMDDPLLAAHHFTGLLLWIPLNKAMFTADGRWSAAERDRYADSAVRVFLGAYGR